MKKDGWNFTLKLDPGFYAGAWAAVGMTDEDVEKPGATVGIPLRLSIGASSFSTTMNLLYTAHAGKSGKAKQ